MTRRRRIEKVVFVALMVLIACAPIALIVWHWQRDGAPATADVLWACGCPESDDGLAAARDRQEIARLLRQILDLEVAAAARELDAATR